MLCGPLKGTFSRIYGHRTGLSALQKYPENQHGYLATAQRARRRAWPNHSRKIGLIRRSGMAVA
jgi:hypothetical protein